jgi:ABC-type nitrate/sulfonate/bicarbonate transport system substrate-binding protein
VLQETQWSRRTLIKIGGLAGAAALVAACGSGDTNAAGSGSSGSGGTKAVKIVNTGSNDTLALQQLMTDKKFFEDFGVKADIQNVSDGTKLMGSVIQSSAHLAVFSGFSQVFPAIAKGGALKLIAGVSTGPNYAVFSAKDDVKSLRDLEGRSVGTGAVGALLHELMLAMLIKNGVDVDSIQFVNVGSSTDVFRAVSAGVVDAGPAQITYFNQQDEFGVHSIAECWKELPDFALQAAFASQHSIDNNRDVLVSTLAAHAKLFHFVSDPSSTDAYLAANKAVQAAEEKQAADLLAFYQENKFFQTDLALTEDRVKTIQELNVKSGTQESVLSYDKVCDMSLAEEAVALL